MSAAGIVALPAGQLEHRRFRVTCVVSSLRGGGAELVISRLANALASRGHDLQLITFSGTDSDMQALSPEVRRVGLAREESSHTLLQRVRNTAARVRALASSVRCFAPDVIVSFTDATNVLTLLTNQILRLPVIVSERVDPRLHPLDAATTALRPWLYATADALVMQTQSSLQWAEQLPRPPRTHVIPNPIYSPVATTCEETACFRPYILAVGRLAKQKGFDVLIRAFSIVHRRDPRLRLVILGEGPERSTLEHLTETLGLRGSVLMPGRRNPAAWLEAAQLFAMTSRYEGFPNALGEAMAAGLPIVSTRCPSGPEEMIDHGESGLLVVVDDVDGIADALLQLDDDAGLRERLGNRARETARERFVPSVIWDAWESVLAQAIKHRLRASGVGARR
ncbi:MAG: glycosyltransferase family 4 protein [Polyangiaceae bacterium]